MTIDQDLLLMPQMGWTHMLDQDTYSADVGTAGDEDYAQFSMHTY
jgi:hypothetical protein